MTDNGARKLADSPIHLGLGATAVGQPPYTGMEWYADYGARHAADAAEGRLVSMHRFTQPWDVWEMHPKGSEVVICTSGAMTLIQEVDGEELRVALSAGEYAINAPGVWHTADVDGEARSAFHYRRRRDRAPRTVTRFSRFPISRRPQTPCECVNGPARPIQSATNRPDCGIKLRHTPPITGRVSSGGADFSPPSLRAPLLLLKPNRRHKMRKHILTASAAALLTTGALTGGVALANHHGGDHKAPMTLAETQAKAAERFTRMDANNDGVLNSADREAKRAERFTATDTNGDGELTHAEMTAAREARRSERAEKRGDRTERRFAKLDVDNSGGVSQAEMDAAQEARAERRGERRGQRGSEARGERRGGGGDGMRSGGKRGGKRGGQGGGAMLRMADTNNDGSVSRAEYDAAVEARFAKADADGNGTVTAEERKAARDAMRELGRAERRGNRGQ